MSKAIEIDIDRALDFLEEHFTNPEQRWGELRALIATQKAAQQSVQRTCSQSASGHHFFEHGVCMLCGAAENASR